MSIEEKIKSALALRAADARVGEDGWNDIEVRLRNGSPSVQPLESVSPRRRVGIALLALLIAFAGLTLAFEAFRSKREAVSTPSSTVRNGKIAFAVLSDSGWQIDTINPDGTSRALLAHVPGDAFHPAWSPDGHRMLLDVQSSDGRMQIFVVNDDGTGLTQLTDSPGWNYLPAWSSDGSKIAFVSTRDGNDEIYVMNADGTTQTRLTDSHSEDLSPSWAPSGDGIAFQSNRGGSNEIYVMNADGTNVARLTDGAATFNGDPSWSPDGARIAFASDRDGPGVYTMNADGTDLVRLTHDGQVGSIDPAWSPDGASIAYTSTVDDSNQLGIVLVEVSTAAREAVPDTARAAGEVCCPSWQPVSSGVSDVPPSPVDIATFCGPEEQLMTMQPLSDRGYDSIEEATLAALSWVGVETSLGDVQQGMSVSAPDAAGEIEVTIYRLPVEAARSDHVFLTEGPDGSYFVERLLECQATHSP